LRTFVHKTENILLISLSSFSLLSAMSVWRVAWTSAAERMPSAKDGTKWHRKKIVQPIGEFK